jgi:hypothetical protein
MSLQQQPLPTVLPLLFFSYKDWYLAHRLLPIWCKGTKHRARALLAGQGVKSQDVSKASPQPAPALVDSSTDTTNSNSSSVPAEHSATEPRQQQLQQQQPGLKGFEDRLSFLELELLKLTLQPDAQLQLLQDPAAAAAARLPSALSAGRGSTEAATAAAGVSHPEALGWPGFVNAADIQNGGPDSQAGLGLISQPELLDPEVLAIAEALLIRKGLPYSAAVFAAPSGAAAQQSQYPQQQQQQQQQGRMRTPSSIWGRRRAAQQLRAKPWRYADDPAAAAAAGTQGLMPYGYQPNNDAGLLRSRGPNSSSSSSSKRGRALLGGIPGPDGFYGNYPAGYGSGFDPRFGPGYPAGYEQGYTDGLMGLEPLNPEGGAAGDDLTPYEPSGWAVAGTVLVVYAGVLLTFFALLAGAGDVGAAVDPADVMLWW